MNKNHRRLSSIFGTIVVLLLLQACASSTIQAAGKLPDTEVERALVTSGFRARAATTPAQRNQLRNLPDNRFTEVKQGGNTYYLYPDKRENRLFAGDHWAYRAYRGYVHNRKLREKGVFVWEVRPSDRANNKTVEIWHGWTPFPEWSPSRSNDY